MKYLLTGLLLIALCLSCPVCMAWDGFDADSGYLVEIIPDVLPVPGSAIDIHNYDTEETQTCLVENIKRNRSTIEVVAICPQGRKRTLVMELH